MSARWLRNFIIISQILLVFGWEQDDFELFDLVEEVNKNFYEELGVKQDASSSEIRKAYRKLSLQYHPDKNKEEDAELKFRQLVSMYEVLKDDDRRKKYDQVLEFGLPDWRQPVYYYRKVRKMGLLEMALILFIIFSVGHFLVIWAVYFEKRFEMEEVFKSATKKKAKKGKKAKQQANQEEELEELLQEELASVPRPTLWDILPCKVVHGTCSFIIGIPSRVVAIKEDMERRKQIKKEQEEERKRLEEEAKQEPEKRSKRKRVTIQYDTDVYDSAEKPVSYTPVQDLTASEAQQEEHKKSEWTHEDFHQLAKAVAKYPGGTSNRWEKIANMLNRDIAEVIAKSKVIKTDYTKVVDTAAQGITGSLDENLQIKKGKTISNDISKRTDFVDSREVFNTNDPDFGLDKQQKRQRPTKTTKTVDRTLMISENPVNESSDSVKNNTNDNSEEVHSIKSEKIKKKVNFSDNIQSITTDSLTKSMEEKAGKVKVDNTECSKQSEVWSQNQQKIFEWGLSQFPKGVEDRWDKIAEHIPGKSKEECIIRFKYLADLVKKKKQMQQKAS